MARLIDADGLIRDMENVCNRSQFGRSTAKMCVKRAPTYQRRSNWEILVEFEEYATIVCQDCKSHINTPYRGTVKNGIKPVLYNYCPNCGAEMNGVK